MDFKIVHLTSPQLFVKYHKLQKADFRESNYKGLFLQFEYSDTILKYVPSFLPTQSWFWLHFQWYIWYVLLFQQVFRPHEPYDLPSKPLHLELQRNPKKGHLTSIRPMNHLRQIQGQRLEQNQQPFEH